MSEPQTPFYNGAFKELKENGYAIAPDFLSPEEAENLRVEFEKLWDLELFKSAGFGKGKDHRIDELSRGDHIYWLQPENPSPSQKPIFEKLNSLRRAVNQHLQLGLLDVEAHYARYAPGAIYSRHRDSFHTDDKRVLSIVLYLNQDWATDDGGKLRLYPNNLRAVDVDPVGGTLVCFLSREVEHEVLPSIKPRLSIAGWFKERSQI